MAEQQYDLFFSGQLLDDHFVDFVKADIKTLFKADDAYVDALFSGKEQLIKRKVDKPTAIKFQQAFKKAGAKLIVKVHNPLATPAPSPAVQPAKPSAERAPTPSATPAPAVTTPKPRPAAITAGNLELTNRGIEGENAEDLIEKHQPDIQAPSAIPAWDVAAPGVTLVKETPFTPANIDTSAISVAEVGANLIARPGFEAPTPLIDISALSVAEVGATLDTLDDKPDPVVVDTSHIRLE